MNLDFDATDESRPMRCWKCGVRPEGTGPSQLCSPCTDHLRQDNRLT